MPETKRCSDYAEVHLPYITYKGLSAQKPDRIWSQTNSAFKTSTLHPSVTHTERTTALRNTAWFRAPAPGKSGVWHQMSQICSQEAHFLWCGPTGASIFDGRKNKHIPSPPSLSQSFYFLVICSIFSWTESQGNGTGSPLVPPHKGQQQEDTEFPVCHYTAEKYFSGAAKTSSLTAFYSGNLLSPPQEIV